MGRGGVWVNGRECTDNFVSGKLGSNQFVYLISYCSKNEITKKLVMEDNGKNGKKMTELNTKTKGLSRGALPRLKRVFEAYFVPFFHFLTIF